MSTLSGSSTPWVCPITTLSSTAITRPPSSRWLACRERVAVHLVRACLRLTARAAERVDRWTDLDVDEADVFEHLLPARTGQPARDSAGPEVDVAQRFGRHRAAIRDVGELEDTAGPQH